MYEAIKLDADLNTMLYTNLMKKSFDIPIVTKNNVVLNSFDQLKLTLSGVGIEVCFTKNSVYLKLSGYSRRSSNHFKIFTHLSLRSQVREFLMRYVLFEKHHIFVADS